MMFVLSSIVCIFLSPRAASPDIENRVDIRGLMTRSGAGGFIPFLMVADAIIALFLAVPNYVDALLRFASFSL